MRPIRFPKGTPWSEVLGVLKGTHAIRECFTHIDDEGKLTRKFDVTGIIEYCVENKVEIVRVGMTLIGYNICKLERGYEQHRLDTITQQVIDNHPVVFCQLPDGTHLMIDGTHRYIKAWDLGKRFILSYLVPEGVWAQFLLPVDENLTAEELLKQDSGL